VPRCSGRDAGFALRHLALELDGAAHRIDYARKFNQHAVAGRLDDGATATAVRKRDPPDDVGGDFLTD